MIIPHALLHSLLRICSWDAAQCPSNGATTRLASSSSACVKYCRYQLSYRNLEEMMRERGLTIDHVTITSYTNRLR